jgi:hypothetical protein
VAVNIIEIILSINKIMSFENTDEHKITLEEFLQRLKTSDVNGLTESVAYRRN